MSDSCYYAAFSKNQATLASTSCINVLSLQIIKKIYKMNNRLQSSTRSFNSSPNTSFGAAFERGCHGKFAIRRLITNSRNSPFSGGLSYLFFNTFNEWTELRKMVKFCCYIMNDCDSGLNIFKH